LPRWILPLAAACALFDLAAPACAADDCYRADAADGEVAFHVLQAGAPFIGKFRRFSGEACLAGDRITRITATLDPASVDTGLPELDANLLKADFFDVVRYPGVTFTGSSVQSQGDTYTVRGTLEIKDNKREVTVVLHAQQAGGKLSISGSITLDRLQYGIGMGEWTNTKWLGAEVKVDINSTLTRKK
jgi:polyisoprenoid-binding protein YceI